MHEIIKKRMALTQMGKCSKGYKKTHLGIIPSDWYCVLLNTILTENKTRNHNAKFNKNDVLSVSGEFGVTNQIELLGRSFAGVSVADYHEVKYGDVVYTKSPLKANPYGIIKQNKQAPGIVSTLYAVYTPVDYETGTYLDYYFSNDSFVNNYLRPLVRKGTKNDMKINNEDALRGEIILPPQEELHKIVKILGCCDEMIRLKKELIAEKKKQKKALMQKLLDPNSGFRLPGFSGEWHKFSLGRLGKCIRGVSYSPTEDLFPTCGEDTFSLLRANNLIAGKVYFDDLQFVARSCLSSTQEIRESDILISMSSGSKKAVGKTAFVNNIEKGYCVGIFCAIFRSQINYLLKYFFDSNNYRKQLAILLEGTNINNLNNADIEGLQIFLPVAEKEQQAIAKTLSSADQEIDLLEQEIEQQEKKKKSLMQLLLTGIVRVYNEKKRTIGTDTKSYR